ncbi:MAG TPA: ABC transporter permease [Alphaproteobacteria bacterium]|nr:ABC transporter permease [Alphaproteobacteria bacterium]
MRDLENRSHIQIVQWLVYPAAAFTAVIFVAPLIVMLCVSFWQRSGGILVAEWTVGNYAAFFSRGFLVDALLNSIEVTVITTVLSVVVAYPLAYILAYRVAPRWQRIILLITVLPFWTAYVVRSYSWLLVISERGVMNQALGALGLVDAPLELAYTRGATVLGFVHFFTMLLTLTIYANLVQINPSYRKAAADLGASAAQTFFRVTLPLSLPGIAVGAFLTFVITIGDYITPQILGGNTEMLVPQAIMLQIGRAANFPMASVMGAILMAIVVLVYAAMSSRLKMDRL